MEAGAVYSVPSTLEIWDWSAIRREAWASPRSACSAAAASAAGLSKVGSGSPRGLGSARYRGAQLVSDVTAQGEGSGGERLRLLTPQTPGVTRGLDGGLLAVGDGTFELGRIAGANGDEAGDAADSVAGG